MDPDEILKVANVIKRSKIQDKAEVFKREYQEFAEKYPILFDMCCDPETEIDKLEYMIEMLKKIQGNKMTQHVASTKVGQRLFDAYVEPVVGKEAGVRK